MADLDLPSMHKIDPGLEGTAEMTVTDADTAVAMKSGAVPVLATPRVVALMEEAACKAIESKLPEGEQSVGISIAIDHIAATPVGVKVSAKAVLDRYVGGMMYFSVTAEDRDEVVARGTHERCFVHIDPFLERAKAKQA